MGRFVLKAVTVLAVLALGPLAVGVAQGADDVSPDGPSPARDPVVATPVVDVDGVDCSAVSDWDTLLKCVEQTETGGLVTITGTVVVPEKAQATIRKPITLTATTGAATSIETTTLDDTFFVIDQGGSLTIGKDTTDAGFSYKDGKRYFAYVKGGSLIINNGVFSGIEVPSDGAVAYSATGGTVIINGGTFANNTARNGGVAYLQDGSTLSIAGGEFDGNKATGAGFNEGPTSGGGVAYGRYASITVTGGTFDGNQAVNGAGGGVFYLFGKGRTLIKGSKDNQIKFSNNVQNPGECTRDAYDHCTAARNGGGVVYMNEDGDTNQGTLTVQGNVLFDGNGEKSAAVYSGGGAIWARGTLYVKNGVDGSRPTFRNNWAMIFKPSGEQGQQIERGGAGGAIFLMMRSTATLTGGVFEDNTSGYLGGAVYTEEDTTTYVGKAVAFDNTAGHFGGGLWFCPSGNSTASKGGNIALYDNKTDPGIDGNPDNAVGEFPEEDVGADSNQAGADLSIMNPTYKNFKDNQFYLMNTWFTDRSKDAVAWHWDNTPLRDTSGFADSWMINPYGGNQGNKAVQASTAMHSSDEIQPEGVITLTKDATPGAFTTGVGFRAEVKDQTSKDKAEKAAQIRLTRNRARMSGGAFGSNGVVVFDTPYSMSWQKVDSSVSPTAPVKTSSTWELSVTLGKDAETGDWLTPYNDDDMRPTDCQITGDTDSDCWKVTSSAGTSQTWTVDIVDNGRRDNDPGMGGIGLDNLAPGTYTLKEKTAPNGYQKTDNEYTFTIVAVTSNDKSIPKEPNLEYAPGYPKEGDDNLSGDASQNARRVIGNKPSTGTLEWTKNDDGNKPIGGSQWTLTGPNGSPKFADIADCTVEGQCGTGAGKDTDATPGRFALDIKGTNSDGTWVFPDGNYTLEETKAPEGYWKTTTTYTLTLGTDQSNNRKVTWGDDATGDFVNKPTSVSWSKVSADDTDQTLPGAEWTITKLDDGGNPTGSSWPVADCRLDACPTPDKGLKDSDTVAGGFTVVNLVPGTYQLVEEKAPDGYAKTDTVYTFTIGDAQTDVVIKIKSGSTGDKVTGNRIVNHAIVTALPFTGGRDGRDWLLIGGGIAILGLAAALIYQRMKRDVK